MEISVRLTYKILGSLLGLVMFAGSIKSPGFKILGVG